MNDATSLLTTVRTPRRSRLTRRDWLVTIGLLALAVIPVLAGSVRVKQLTVSAATTPVTADNARFFAAPLPVIIHIVASSLYAVLGAFQFAPGLRLRYPRWHRRVGWLLLPSGLASALTGLWMAHFYPWPAGDGQALYVLRLVFGSVMTASLIQSAAAIRRRDFVRHGAWMVRAYAIGMGAGTQVLTHMAWLLLFGTPGEAARALTMGGGWVINLLAAEWVISRRLTRPGRRTVSATSTRPS